MPACLSVRPSVRPSVRLFVLPHGTTRLPVDGFLLNFIFEIFRKSVENIQFSLKSYKDKGYFTLRHFNICDNISLNSFWNEKCFRKIYRENQNTYFLSNNCFFFKSCRLRDNAEKHLGARGGHKWRHNMAHASCMLDKQGYMHTGAHTRPRVRKDTRTQARKHARTHREICNNYCFSSALMICQSASLLPYTYIVCLVILYYKIGNEILPAMIILENVVIAFKTHGECVHTY